MNEQDKKRYAALSYALASVRGVLNDVISGDVDKDEAKRIFEGTSLENISKSIGMEEEGINWNDFLSEEEKQKIVGR